MSGQLNSVTNCQKELCFEPNRVTIYSQTTRSPDLVLFTFLDKPPFMSWEKCNAQAGDLRD